MNKTIIIAIVMILAILGVGVAIRYTKGTTDVRQTQEQQEATGNPASDIGEGEYKFTPENFQKEVRDYKGVVFVDFYLPTCSYCKAAGPIISEVAKETQGKYKVGKINAQVASELTSEFKIESVPTQIIFKDGKEVSRLVGAQKKEAILEKLAEAEKI